VEKKQKDELMQRV